MNVILYASISANGNVLLAEDAAHEIPKEIMADFMQQVMKTRNLVIGRKTFEVMMQNPAAAQGFTGIDLVVISRTMQTAEGFTVVSSPQEALDHLVRKDHTHALIAGGTQIYHAFLAGNLVHELYLNINPVLTDNGNNLLKDAQTMSLELLEQQPLTAQIVQLRYAPQNN